VCGQVTLVLKAQCTSKVDPACSSWESNASQNSTILAPLSAITPAVTVSIATQIGPCDDLFLDMTSSSGAGGRLWKSVSFVVFGSDPNITKLQHFLSTSINPSLVRAPFTIPSRLLSPGYGYSLEVKLCNFLNSCGSIIKSFVVSFSSEVPMVFLNSPNSSSPQVNLLYPALPTRPLKSWELHVLLEGLSCTEL
jgi:hypothetical protein